MTHFATIHTFRNIHPRRTFVGKSITHAPAKGKDTRSNDHCDHVCSIGTEREARSACSMQTALDTKPRALYDAVDMLELRAESVTNNRPACSTDTPNSERLSSSWLDDTKPMGTIGASHDAWSWTNCVDMAVFGVQYVRGRYEVVAWNRKAVETTGYPAHEVLSCAVQSFVVDSNTNRRQELLQSIENALTGRDAIACTVQMKNRTQESRSFRIKPSAQRDRDGNIVGVACFVEQIDSCFSIENQLRNGAVASSRSSSVVSEEVDLRVLVDSANAAIVALDVNGCVTEWNEATVEITSYTEAEAIQKPFLDTFIDVTSKETVREVLDNALKGHCTSNFQMDIHTRQGEQRHLLVNASALMDSNSNIRGAVIIAQNVTEATMHDRAVAAMAEELRQLVESSNAAVFGVDRDGDVNEWNDKTARITGFTKDEAFDTHFVSTFISSPFRQSVQDVLGRALRGEATSNYELEFKAKDGDIRNLLMNASPRRDIYNNVVGVVGVAQDITEATRHDRAVEAMARELRQLVQTSNAPIFGIDTTGNVNEWNDKMAEITGFPAAHAVGKALVEKFIVPKLRQSVQEVLDNALAGRGTSNYELEFCTQSNDIRVLLVNATTRRDTESNIIGVVGVAQDITEAVQRDRAVAGMANELRQLIDEANAPIFGIDCDGNINEWNNKTAHITGFSKEEAFDEPLVSQFIAKSHRKSVQEVLDQALLGNETSNYEVEFLTKSSDTTRFLLVNATTRRDPENNVVGVVGVAQDVTDDRKHAQELREMQYYRASQEAKVETERNMTAYFAHELRNPLGAIDSALSAMPDALPKTAKDLVGAMQLCTGFMSSIMNNLLDVRKMEEGKMTLHSVAISLEDVLDGVYRMLLPSVRQHVKFVKQIKTNGKNWVLGDAHRIQQVMTNVVTNAIKYTVSGSITLIIEWEGDNMRFECADTGPGIPKNEQKKLFERFVQRGGAPGTGLGLAIAKHLVDLTGGTICFISDPSVKAGTSCVVTMPLPVCSPPDDDADAEEDKVKMIEDPLNILIVDDVKMNRMLLKRRIQKSIAPNSTIVEASTGEAALKLCGREKFDLVVVDQYMEEAGGIMVGTDVVFAMRRMRISSVIIGCSGNDMDEQFYEAGADMVWKKPMPSDREIIEHLNSSIAKRRRLE